MPPKRRGPKRKKQEHIMENARPPLPEIQPLDSDKVNVRAWFQYFDRECENHALDAEWKVRNFSRYIKNEFFQYFIENCMDLRNFDEIQEAIVERFDKKEDYYEQFLRLKLHEDDDVDTYYHKKVELAKRMRITDEFLLQNLTHSSYQKLKEMLSVANPQNYKEWLQAARRIKASQPPQQRDKKSVPEYRPREYRQAYRPPWPNHHFTRRPPPNNPTEGYRNMQPRDVQTFRPPIRPFVPRDRQRQVNFNDSRNS